MKALFEHYETEKNTRVEREKEILRLKSKLDLTGTNVDKLA